jgi:hypothetical protein
MMPITWPQQFGSDLRPTTIVALLDSGAPALEALTMSSSLVSKDSPDANSSVTRPFLEQAASFFNVLSMQLKASNLDSTDVTAHESSRPLKPTIIEDLGAISSRERDAIRNSYLSTGVAAFVAKRTLDPSTGPTPLLVLADQLRDGLDLNYPISHPKDSYIDGQVTQDRGAARVFDHGGMQQFGTSNSSEFVLHQDGLGSTGAVRTVMLYMSSAAMAGGYSCFQNLTRVVLELAVRDWAAFRGLFLPDAITIIRPTGARAVKVTGPVLFFDNHGHPHINFVGVSPTRPVGDYRVRWTVDLAARRGLEFMLLRSMFFGPGSVFIHMDRSGCGVLFDNTRVIHGRTEFIDAPEFGVRRVIWRKWYAPGVDLMVYRHAPGIRLPAVLAGLRPDLFGPNLLSGEWRYVHAEDRNMRVA